MKKWIGFLLLLAVFVLLPGCMSAQPDTGSKPGTGTVAEPTENDKGSTSGQTGSPGNEVKQDQEGEQGQEGQDGKEDQEGKQVQEGEESETDSPPATVVAENEAFRVFEPAPDSEVGNTFIVRGEARVFEAAFSYSFEDGHYILDEGHAQASMGAPEWGKFEFQVQFDDASSPTGILTIYEASAKDGSPIHVLNIPYKIKPELVKR